MLIELDSTLAVFLLLILPLLPSLAFFLKYHNFVTVSLSFGYLGYLFAFLLYHLPDEGMGYLAGVVVGYYFGLFFYGIGILFFVIELFIALTDKTKNKKQP